MIDPSAFRVAVPSMEPPPFGDGNVDAYFITAWFDKPSMEPPPFGDGNRYLRLNPDLTPSLQCGFRGAGL